MLQIKNTLGGGKPEGLYAWKKNSYSPAVSLENPTFDYISATVSSSSSDYTFGNFSFDISIIDDWKKFFTGFVNTNGYGSNFPSYGVFHNYSDNGNWNYTVSEVNLSAGTVTIHIGGYCGDYKSEGTYKYTGTKVVSEEIKEFIDYIVSDKETAFPDGGEKGGYWYEKVADILGLLGCTKISVETLIPTSNISVGFGTYTLNHGLGEIPKYAILLSEGATASNTLTRMLWMYIGRSGDYQTSMYEYLDSSGKTSLGVYRNSKSQDSTATQITIGTDGSGQKLVAGIKYTLITMA